MIKMEYKSEIMESLMIINIKLLVYEGKKAE